MKSILKLSFIFLLAGIIIGCAGGEEDAGDTNGQGDEAKGTITFGVTPWTSTIPPTKVAKLILEDMGYTVEETNADAGGVYAGLSQAGELDVFMDAWLPDMHANYMDKFGDKIEDIAVSYPDGELGWVMPTYVEGIDSIEDIKGNEDKFEGKIYGIEEGAGMTVTSKEMIEAYDLNLQYVASSEGGMMAQASRMIKNEEPVLFLGWRPHPMFANYDLKVLEDPQEFFKTSEVHVLVNETFETKFPDAHEFLSNWSIDVGDIEAMIVQIEDEDRDAEEVAQEWIDNNQDKVNEMTGQ